MAEGNELYFSGEWNEHLEDFLDKFGIFFENNGFQENQKFQIIGECLIGNARRWFDHIDQYIELEEQKYKELIRLLRKIYPCMEDCECFRCRARENPPKGTSDYLPGQDSNNLGMTSYDSKKVDWEGNEDSQQKDIVTNDVFDGGKVFSKDELDNEIDTGVSVQKLSTLALKPWSTTQLLEREAAAVKVIEASNDVLDDVELDDLFEGIKNQGDNTVELRNISEEVISENLVFDRIVSDNLGSDNVASSLNSTVESVAVHSVNIGGTESERSSKINVVYSLSQVNVESIKMGILSMDKLDSSFGGVLGPVGDNPDCSTQQPVSKVINQRHLAVSNLAVQFGTSEDPEVMDQMNLEVNMKFRTFIIRRKNFIIFSPVFKLNRSNGSRTSLQNADRRVSSKDVPEFKSTTVMYQSSARTFKSASFRTTTPSPPDVNNENLQWMFQLMMLQLSTWLMEYGLHLKSVGRPPPWRVEQRKEVKRALPPTRFAVPESVAKLEICRTSLQCMQ